MNELATRKEGAKMSDYLKKLHDLLLGADDPRSILSLPLGGPKKRSEIDFRKVRGSVRLQNELVLTEEEAEQYIESVLQMELP